MFADPPPYNSCALAQAALAGILSTMDATASAKLRWDNVSRADSVVEGEDDAAEVGAVTAKYALAEAEAAKPRAADARERCRAVVEKADVELLACRGRRGDRASCTPSGAALGFVGSAVGGPA